MFSPAQSSKVSLGAVSGMLCAALLQGRPLGVGVDGSPQPGGSGCRVLPMPDSDQKKNNNNKKVVSFK